MNRLGYFQEYWKYINGMEPSLKNKMIDFGMGGQTLVFSKRQRLFWISIEFRIKNGKIQDEYYDQVEGKRTKNENK